MLIYTSTTNSLTSFNKSLDSFLSVLLDLSGDFGDSRTVATSRPTLIQDNSEHLLT